MAKVVHMSTVHRPYDVRIFHKQAVSLARAGHEVVVLGQAPDAAERNGVRVSPMPVYASRLRRATMGGFAACRMALAEQADLYHFHDPELIPVGLFLKACGKRVIYDAHEDVRKDLSDKAYLPCWTRAPLRLAVAACEGAAEKVLDQVVAATSSIADNFHEAKVTLVRNTPILDELAPPMDAPAFRDRLPRVIYVGGLAPFNGAEQMIQAMGELPEDSDIRLILGGSFSSPEDERRFRAMPGWKRVDYQGWTPREKLAPLFAQARAGLVVYQPTPNIMHSEPNKFLEVLSAGLPLIASDLPGWRLFIDENQCGVLVRPTDPKAIAQAMLALVGDPDRAEAMGRNGRTAVVERFNWSVDEARLVGLYDRLLTRQPAEA